MLATVLVGVLSLCAQGSPAQSTWPGLELNALGVLTRVPEAGLESVDGPRVHLRAGFAEWFGVRYTQGAVRRAFVGCGTASDWDGRVEAQALGLALQPGSVVARARAGALEVRTELAFEGELLIARVTLTNRGAETLVGLLYSREWRTGAVLGWTFPPDWEERVPPSDVACRLWMPDDLAPGASTGCVFSYRHGLERTPLGSVDVPLALFTNADWPNGLILGRTNGVSFGDFDADGWIDIFACDSARLLRNVQGATWELAADLDGVLPPANNRYGSSFGDYDNDGLPDLGTEPRVSSGDSCLHLLKNLGAAQFVDVAIDPALMIGQPCEAPAETICWGDVEEDGDLDLFLPVYPRSAGGPGNFFLENLGPTGPAGAYRLRERSAEVGLNNPPQTARPEGAQFVDVDDDGDLDLYSNGVLYQNRSEAEPEFAPMLTEGSGIGLRDALDEGAAFFDYDLDGDQDLFIVYTNRGVRFWESRGDGTFFQGELATIDQRDIGLDLGLSAEDWDNDGDVDFTTRQVFRQNRLVEDGTRHFTVATHSIPAGHLTSATPAWGDWDKDGDLDCALGNWQSIGHFYENTLYDASVPATQKPYVRVRVVRDDPAHARGLETEYGASVELVLHGDPHRREKFVASGHGYLNQNEYALHFALPPGADPEHPLVGLVFDLVVDFPSRASRGVQRIDRFVNAELGDIRLEDLAQREITVFRSGRVELDGLTHAASPDGLSPRLFATAGGLALPDPSSGLPAMEAAPTAAHWVGLEFRVEPARAVRAKELVLDGQLAAPLAGAPFNLALWDVTDPLRPLRVRELAATTSSRNRRTHFAFERELEPAHVYRCVALVSERRGSPFSVATNLGGASVKGGLAFQDAHPLTGKELVRAAIDPTRVYLALRTVVGSSRRR
ncbi:MAG: VCBS repeat-containing protein [Planctomycetes bacterium]|nr:VCBS repeat-containing protein [Planctomycetota bacterium]